MIRIGILGAGAMGVVHAAAWTGVKEARVVAVFSRDPVRARAAAAINDSETVAEATTLIAHRDIDAVDVCLPSTVHRAFAVPALEAGKHVFCETPMALSLDDAEAMLAAARKAGRLLQVGLLTRSLSQYRHVKDLATSGEHGRLLSVATHRLGSYLHPGAADHKAHYSDPSTELMTFDFDFVQWLMGQPRRLMASATRQSNGAPGEISALLDYGDGRHASVLASGLMPPVFPFSVGFRALFEKASFQLETNFEGDGPPASTFTMFRDHRPGENIALPGNDPYQRELQHFVDCIGGRADDALLDGERAVEALILSLATQRALAKDGEIELR